MFLVNLLKSSEQDELDLTGAWDVPLEESPEFVNSGYLKYKFQIKTLEYYPRAEDEDYRDEDD